jgi:hypothetical protein
VPPATWAPNMRLSSASQLAYATTRRPPLEADSAWVEIRTGLRPMAVATAGLAG